MSSNTHKFLFSRAACKPLRREGMPAPFFAYIKEFFGAGLPSARKRVVFCKRLSILAIIISSGCQTHHTQPTKDLSSQISAPAPLNYLDPLSNNLPVPLTLSDAIARATLCNAEISRLQNELQVAQHNTSKDLRDPELRLSYGEDETNVDRYRWNDSGSDITNGKTKDESSAYRVAIRFFMPNMWTQSPQELQFNAIYQALNEELFDEKKRTSSEVRKIFAEINNLSQKRKLAKLLVSLHAQKQKQVDKLTQSGNLSALDGIEFSRRYLRASAELTQIEMRYNRAINSLADTLCVSSSDIQIETSAPTLLHVDSSDAGINELQALMMLNRSDLKVLGWHRIESEAALKVHQRTRLPWLQHMQLSYGTGNGTSTGSDNTSDIYGNTQNDFRDDSGDDEAWAITTAINIPIYGSAKNERNVLTTKIQQAENKEQMSIIKAKTALRDTCLSLRQHDQIRKQHQKQTLPIIQKMRTALKSHNNSSSLSFEDQIKMYEDLANAKQLLLDLDYNYQTALIKLDQTIGLPLFHLQQ